MAGAGEAMGIAVDIQHRQPKKSRHKKTAFRRRSW